MKRSWFRFVSAVVAASLLAIAVRPASLRAGPCDLILQRGGNTGSFPLVLNAGVTQPIGSEGTIAACSLTVVPNWGFARLELVQWDPLTLAPDPTTIALRTRAFGPSDLMYNRTRADFSPPVVTRSLAGVADPPRPTTAIDYRATSVFSGTGHPVGFEADGPPGVPIALQYPPGGPRSPLPGGHPVLSHAVCGGRAALQDLQVIQSVMTTNQLSDTSCFEIVQRFRVPERSKLHWVEVAFGVPPRPIYYDPIIAILDARGESEPPVALRPSLVEAPFVHFVNTPFWGSHFDFDRYITLEPGRDYWLLVRVEHQYVLYSRTRTGGESREFMAAIGPGFRRTTPEGNWIPERGRALCFRLIGEPAGVSRTQPRGRLRERPLGESGQDAPAQGRAGPGAAAAAAGPTAAPGAVQAGPFTLRVAPNPARGSALVSWSGSAGPVRLDVHDAQGRRVAGVTDARGEWLWRGARADGGPLPAGLYFVRATDVAGLVASARLVLIR